MRYAILWLLVFWVWLAVLPGAFAIADDGMLLYHQNCADCHRRSGEGLPDKFPSLVGNALVVGDPARLAETVLQGRRGKLGFMPAWKGTLTEGQVASILTYIRAAWGNQGSSVTEESISKRPQP